MKEWLTLAYGDDEANRIMTISEELPEELREALYGNILKLGPAGDEIAQVMLAVGEALGNAGRMWDIHTTFDVFTRSPFTVNGGIAGSPFTQVKAFLSPYEDMAWFKLNAQFRIMAANAVVFTPSFEGAYESTVEGMVSLAWMLTAPYVIPADHVMKDGLVITRTNHLLTKLGFSRLGGSFNDCVDGSRL